MSEWQPRESVLPGLSTWVKYIPDGRLTVMKSIEPINNGALGIHLSISHSPKTHKPRRYPTWDEQKAAVWTFAKGLWMVSYLPPQDSTSYVNFHDTTFHWWETESQDTP